MAKTDREDALILFDYLNVFIARVDLYGLEEVMLRVLEEQAYEPKLKLAVIELIKNCDG